MIRSLCCCLLAVISITNCFAQTGLEEFNNILAQVKKSIISNSTEQFYRLHAYQPVWLAETLKREQLFALLHLSTYEGLNEQDYQYTLVSSLKSGSINLKSYSDSLAADIMLTDAALHFFEDLAIGNNKPSLRFYGIGYSPKAGDVAARLLDLLNTGRLLDTDARPAPLNIGFASMKHLLAQLEKTTSAAGFRELKITSSKVDLSNVPLLTRLYQWGLTDSIHVKLSQPELVQKLKLLQGYFDILADGKLRSTTLLALNTPIEKRKQALCLAMNDLRWLEGLIRKSIAVVNIPSASLLVYDSGAIYLDSKLVVGRVANPTPALSSTITELVLYPYWMVPNSIALKELLPQIRKDAGYLKANNFQVLNSQGKVVDPYSINWNALGSGYFPYRIRQSTGCDNSLGIVKFNFYNPFTVYLHDTPFKDLFQLNKRYFSHGCMRVEKPTELAHYLLGSNSIAFDTLTQKGCLENQQPIVVPAERPLPVIVLYHTAWYDKKGAVKFYDDVYGKFR